MDFELLLRLFGIIFEWVISFLHKCHFEIADYPILRGSFAPLNLHRRLAVDIPVIILIIFRL